MKIKENTATIECRIICRNFSANYSALDKNTVQKIQYVNIINYAKNVTNR